MCKLFAYVGESNEEIARLHEALKRSSENDVIGVKYKKSKTHGNGWGYAIYASNGLFHYRTGKAIYEDDHEIPKVEGKAYAIFHARFATDKKKIGSIFSHPYFAAADDRLIWLAHHGELHDKVITAPHLVDSECILKFVVERGTEKGIKASKLATQSALNVCILEIKRATMKASLRYINYYLNDSEKEYYDMHYSRMKKGVAVFSSTLTAYGFAGAATVKRGTLEELA